MARGTTENISRSGMLFQAEEFITPNAQLEINSYYLQKSRDWQQRK